MAQDGLRCTVSFLGGQRACTYSSPPPPACFAVLQYKFIVDGEWRYDANLPRVYDDMGNINNMIEVQVCNDTGALAGRGAGWQRCGRSGGLLLLRLLRAALLSLLPPPMPSTRCAKCSATSPVAVLTAVGML